MKTAGVIGIGNMGSGLAKNLMAGGFIVPGYDLLSERMREFTDMGGHGKNNAAEVGDGADDDETRWSNYSNCYNSRDRSL